MQHSVDTVDPNLLDLKQFPQLSTSEGAAAQDEPVVYRCRHNSFNRDSNPSFNGTGAKVHRISNDQFNNQLEILGQFEFSSTLEPDGRLRSWDNQNIVDDAVIKDEILDGERFGHVGPWNHLQSFGSQAIYPSHRYRLSSDLSSDVPSSIGTTGWPGNSPPDSSSAFALFDSVIDARRQQHAEPLLPTNKSATTYSTHHENLMSLDSNPTAQALLGQGVPKFHVSEGDRRISNGISYETLDLHIESPPLDQRYEALSSQHDGILLDSPIEALSSYHNVTAFNHHDKPISDPNDEPGLYYYDDLLSEYAELTHPQSAIISIEGVPKCFQLDAESPFPTTPGYFSDYWPSGPIEESRPTSKPTPRSLSLRPASRNSKGLKKQSITITEPPLSVIHEDGKGGLASSSPTTKKGRRAGPLSKSKAAQAAKMRKEKSVCIRCKMMKQSCSGEDPCTGCRENVGAKIWKSPCVKAEFLDLIEAGTCNYISQRSINHLTLDQSRRVTMLLPTAFDLTELLDLLKPRLSLFNIHARQLSGSLYTLDLAKCYDFLTEIRNVQESGKFELRDFIDNKLLKASDWLKCVTEPCSISESLALLAKWNNMPSRASYDIVSLSEGVSSRPMDIENPDDQAEILIAAQLSRIICRALEVAAFKFLQKELNNLTKGSKSNEGAENFVRELGQLLVTLRWRISWWELLGDGSAIRDDSRDRYVERVKNLTRVLYFYYCSAKKKLPSWTEPQSLQGVQSCYADAEPIFDNFPHADSIEGFLDWMKHGQDLIAEAGVQRRLSRY